VAEIEAVIMFYDKIIFIGRLPGDLNIRIEKFRFYFPVTAGIIVNVVISPFDPTISFFDRKVTYSV